jgi:hypothetical protein
MSDEQIFEWLTERQKKEKNQLQQTALLLRSQLDELSLTYSQTRLLERHYIEYGITPSSLRFLDKKSFIKVYHLFCSLSLPPHSLSLLSSA